MPNDIENEHLHLIDDIKLDFTQDHFISSMWYLVSQFK